MIQCGFLKDEIVTDVERSVTARGSLEETVVSKKKIRWARPKASIALVGHRTEEPRRLATRKLPEESSPKLRASGQTLRQHAPRRLEKSTNGRTPGKKKKVNGAIMHWAKAWQIHWLKSVPT